MATYGYGDVSLVQVPVARSEGVIVTVDASDPLPDDFVSRCRAILLGEDG